MLRKKMLAILITCALILTVSYYHTATLEAATSYGNLLLDDFETDSNGWGPRGSETVTISTEQAYSGTQSLKVSDRTQTWNGAMCNKTADLTLGETYNLGIWIKYAGDSYSGTQNFSLQLQYNDGVTDVYKNIKTSSVTKGQWTYLEGEYTIPTDAADVNIYVETEYKTSPSDQDLMDFYLDDFTATPAVLPDIETDIASLKDVFAPYFDIGCAGTASEIAPAPGKALILKHYNCITFGNELKPDSVLDYDATASYMEANGGDQVNPQVNLRAARTLLEFARDNNIPVRGHTLVWHNQTPDWFFKENYSTDSGAAWVSKEIMLQRLENYIKNLMALLETDYPTVEFYAWDVVNEAVDPNTSTGMRNPGSNNTTSGSSPWMQTIGSDYIEKAFEYARKYAPEGCKLFYNDYNEYETTKSNFIYNILENLKGKGLVDGMGMQSHWTMDYPNISMFETAVRKYASLGLEIQLTELDMKQPDNSANALSLQAARYKLLMNKCVSLKEEGINITAVIFWGITDETSWLGGYPLLFDGEYKAKPAFYSIIEDLAPTGTVTPTPTVSVTPTITPTPSVTPTITPTPTVTPAPETGTPVTTVTTTQNNNTVNQTYKITAENGTIDLSKLEIVFTADGISGEKQNVWCDNAALQLNTAPWYTDITSSVNGTITDASLTVTFNDTVNLSEGTGTCIVNIRFAKADWSDYDTISNPVLKVYYDGTLVQ